MESQSPAQLAHRCHSTNRLVSFILKIKISRTETHTYKQLGQVLLCFLLISFPLLSDFSAPFSFCLLFKHGLYISIHCNFDHAISYKKQKGDFWIIDLCLMLLFSFCFHFQYLSFPILNMFNKYYY